MRQVVDNWGRVSFLGLVIVVDERQLWHRCGWLDTLVRLISFHWPVHDRGPDQVRDALWRCLPQKCLCEAASGGKGFFNILGMVRVPEGVVVEKRKGCLTNISVDAKQGCESQEIVFVRDVMNDELKTFQRQSWM